MSFAKQARLLAFLLLAMPSSAAAGNRDYEIVIMPGMNHSLVVSQRGGRTEETPNQMHPDLLRYRIEWLRTHLSL